MASSMKITDAQVHLHNRTFFEAHLGRKDFPRAERDGQGYVLFTSTHGNTPIPPHYFDIERQLEDFRAAGIDRIISSMGSFNVNHLSPRQATDLAMQINEERAELQRQYKDYFYGLALIPMQDPRAAIEVLDHAIRVLGLYGVCITSNVNGESIADLDLEPVYRRIETLDVPIFLHPTTTVHETANPRYGHEFTVGYMTDGSIAALDLIFSGILDRYPRLRVLHPHLGGVLPYLAARIDHEYNQPWTHSPDIENPPSTYLSRFYTDAVSLSPFAMKACLEIYGPDQILFSSDYPYWAPSVTLDFVRREVPEEHLEAVLSGNAERLLGL